MTGTAKGSIALYTEVGTLIAPNGNGQVTATILAGVFNDIIASYPNTTDGLGGYSSIGTVTGGTWNGSNIDLAHGGTNASLVASVGGIFYSTAGAGAILAGTATAQQMLMSGANAAPSWSTTTWPATLAANRILYSSATNIVSSLPTANGGIVNTSAAGVPSVTATPLLGVPGSIGGTLALAGSASGTMTLAASATAGSVTFTFPSAAGTSGQLMQASGGGVLNWTTSAFPSGSVAAYSLLYASSANTWAALATNGGGILNTNSGGIPSVTASPVIGLTGTVGGSIGLNGLTSGLATISVKAAAGTTAFTLPVGNGVAGNPLVGDGAGNLSYTSALALGANGGTGGSVTLNGSTSGAAVIGTNATAGTTTFTLPVGNGTSGQILQTDGSGNTTWAAPIIQSPPQGRLTLTTGTPVMNATVNAANTIYYTPYIGNIIPLWNGSTFIYTTFTEISNALGSTGPGGGPGVTASNNVYDLFVFNNGGTPTLNRGVPWTSSTNRGTGAGTTQLTRVNGILVNQQTMTGLAAGYGTYVGTFATDPADTGVTWNIGSNNTAGQLNLWNAYNRASGLATVTDTQAAYTYSTSTIRQSGGSAYNDIAFVVGLQEDAVVASLSTVQSLLAYVTNVPYTNVGIGLNSTTTFAGPYQRVSNGSAYVSVLSASSTLTVFPQLGKSVIYSVEQGDGTHLNTFNNTSNNTLTLTVRS